MELENNWIPLPDESQVLRNVSLATDGKINPYSIEPSSDDKLSPSLSMTVWDMKLTTPHQSLQFMSENNREKYTHFVVFSVVKIRAIRCTCTEIGAENLRLDVISLPHANEDLKGHEGHCGIAGLVTPPQMSKKLYMDMRRQILVEAYKTLKRLDEYTDETVPLQSQ